MSEPKIHISIDLEMLNMLLLGEVVDVQTYAGVVQLGVQDIGSENIVDAAQKAHMIISKKSYGD